MNSTDVPPEVGLLKQAVSASFRLTNASGKEIHGLPVGAQCFLVGLYSITALMSVLGNLLVIVVYFIGRQPRSDLRILLVNLAFSDVVMAIFCMPFTFAYTMLNKWVFGRVMCTLVLYMQNVAVIASVGTSMAIAVDRYLAVANPMGARSSQFNVVFAVLAIWFVSATLGSAQLAVGRVTDVMSPDGVPVTECLEVWPEPKQRWRIAYSVFMLVSTYLLPLFVIAIAYGLISRILWRRKTPGNANAERDAHQLKSTRKVGHLMSLPPYIRGDHNIANILSPVKPRLHFTI